MDELLLQLKQKGVGCHWSHLVAGALCYANDLILLAPSLSALRIMLHTCESFSVSHGLKFNASKTLRSSDVEGCLPVTVRELSFYVDLVLRSLEVAFNSILRKIWRLPY